MRAPFARLLWISPFLALLAGAAPSAAQQAGGLTISSPAFAAGGAIPRRYSCDGANTAPPLAWRGVPDGARSLALIVDDPDAPGGVWVHWVVYDIPLAARGLPEGGALPRGAFEGRNDWDKPAYGGPCPPGGRHRYVFRLYALDTLLPRLDPPTRAALDKAMKGHVLAGVRLTGTYRRGK